MATDKYIPKHMNDEKLEKKPKNKIIIALTVVVAILVICIVWGLISAFSVQKIASDIKVSVKTFASAVVHYDKNLDVLFSGSKTIGSLLRISSTVIGFM